MKTRQQGLAMLTLCLLLTVAATWLAMTVMHLTLDRQQAQADDYRSEALFSAAEAGLSFAMSWLSANTPHWVTKNNSTETARPDILPPPAAGSFRIRQSIVYQRDITRPALIWITADARSGSNHRQVSQAVQRDKFRIIPVAGSWHDFQ